MSFSMGENKISNRTEFLFCWSRISGMQYSLGASSMYNFVVSLRNKIIIWKQKQLAISSINKAVQGEISWKLAFFLPSYAYYFFCCKQSTNSAVWRERERTERTICLHSFTWLARFCVPFIELLFGYKYRRTSFQTVFFSFVRQFSLVIESYSSFYRLDQFDSVSAFCCKQAFSNKFAKFTQQENVRLLLIKKWKSALGENLQQSRQKTNREIRIKFLKHLTLLGPIH